MKYIPTNKTTGMEYPPITEAEMLAYEADPILKGKYTFKAVETATLKENSKPTEEKKKTTAPPPVEAKAVKAIPEGEE